MRRNEARFWVYVNGAWARVKIAAGATLTWGRSAPTDEGWHSEVETWRFDGQTVDCEFDEDGRDCDGRLSAHTETTCPVHLLRARRIDDFPEGLPEWERVRESQRDYAAEAAGY